MSRLPAPRPDPAADTVAYIRVSREEQARADKTSLADQHTRISTRAAEIGRTLGRVFEDAGVSGGTANRPAFRALCDYCEANPRPLTAPGYVLVLDDSRWGRFPDPEEGAYWRVHLGRFGWRVRFCIGDDTDDTMARTLQRAMWGSAATAEREKIRQRARQGAAGTAERGYWGCEAPLGYRREAVNIRTGRTRVLEVGERKADDERVRLTPGPDTEVATVRRLFETYARGDVSLRSLVLQAEAWCPGRRWARTGLQAVLTNPAYIGTVRAAGVTTPNAHPAIIATELFERVQARLALNRKATTTTTGGYPLSGLIVCADCGCPYIGGGGRKGPEHDHNRYRFYRDSNLERRVTCTGPIGTTLKRFLEPAVIGAVAEVVSRPDVLAAIGEEFDRALGAAGDGQDTRKAALEARRAAAEARRDRIVRAIGDGAVSEADAARVLAECRRDIEAATGDSERLRFEGRRTGALALERDRLLAMAADFPALARRLTGHALRELIRPWLHSATFDKRSKKLRLAIRRVPAIGVIGLATSPGLSGQDKYSRLLVRRTVQLPGRPRKAVGA